MKEQQQRIAGPIPVRKALGLALGISLGGAAALEACAPQQQPQAQAQVREAQVPAQKQPPSTPEARIVMPAVGRAITQTVESAPAAVPSATPEPPKPTATATKTSEPTVTPKPEPTKEVEKEVPCQILPTEFCSQAERVVIKTETTNFIYLGFRNLPPGTKIHSPVNGFFTITKERGPQFVGSQIVLYTPNIKEATGGAIIRGVMNVDDIVQRSLKAGEVIGSTKGDKTLNEQYNLLFTITKRTPNGPVTDEDVLKQLAPVAFEKPITNSMQSSDRPNSTVVFTLPPGAQPTN